MSKTNAVPRIPRGRLSVGQALAAQVLLALAFWSLVALIAEWLL